MRIVKLLLMRSLTGLKDELRMASRTSRTTRVIRAPRDNIFDAFLDPAALVAWMSPGDMTGEVHHFDGRLGGGYEMSLYYPVSETGQRGKTTEREDRFTARFTLLERPRRIVQIISFDSADPALAGEMTMDVALRETGDGTEVTISFENIPPGVRPEDNDAGTRSSLEKLARHVESDESTTFDR